MSNTFNYLLQVNLVLVLLYACFSLIINKNTIPVFNRFVILLIPIISFLLPCLSFNLEANPLMPGFQLPGFTGSAMSFSELELNQQEGLSNTHFSLDRLIWLTWLTGISMGILFTALGVYKKLKLINKYGIIQIENHPIVPADTILQPFSFMRIIYLNLSRYDQKSLKTLILHEKAHIRQYHYLDLIIMEIFRLVLWFNPVVWLLYRKLQENHEYLADRYVLQQGIKRSGYYGLILQHVDSMGLVSLESSLSRFKTIKRFKMMKTNYSKKHLIKKIILSIMTFSFFVVSFGFMNAEYVPAEQTDISDKAQVNISPDPPSISPVDPGVVRKTSGYGMRMHPIKKVEMLHKGIDLAAAEGTEVFATAEGIVQETGFNKSAGNFIVLKHDDIYTSFYSQLNSIKVKKGDKVHKKMLIGTVGSTGLSTGPHLHYEVRKNGEAVDPEPYMKE